MLTIFINFIIGLVGSIIIFLLTNKEKQFSAPIEIIFIAIISGISSHSFGYIATIVLLFTYLIVSINENKIE